MFFVGITFANKRVELLFDLARIVLEPEFARKSHITLRGPYKSKKNVNSAILEKQIGSFTLSKPSTFFNERQNTVYLRAEIPGIADYWYKPDYPKGTPHLSIYDGSDRKLAWQVLMSLRKHPWRLEFASSRLKLLDSKERLETRFLMDYLNFDAAFKSVVPKEYRMEELKTMHVGQRIDILERIFEEIHRCQFNEEAANSEQLRMM